MATEINPEGDTDISREEGAFAAVRPVEPVEEQDSDAEYVIFRGVSHIRRITEEQWKQAGVEDQPETVWDKGNNFQVPVSELSEKAIKALRNDGSFSVPAAE